MRNAVTMAAKWQMLLPAGERPEYTELYEGFYHSLRINGGTDKFMHVAVVTDPQVDRLLAPADNAVKLTLQIKHQTVDKMQIVVRHRRVLDAQQVGL